MEKMPKIIVNKLIPKHCPSCNSLLKVEGIHLVCKNPECKEQKILQILHWVTTRGMEFFSESSIRALYESRKIKNICDLYKLTESNFIGLEGFGTKKINNALDQIENTKEMTIGQFCDAIGIDLVGEKAIKKLGITTTEQFLSFDDTTYVVGKNIVHYIKNNKDFITELLSLVKIKKVEKVSDSAKNVAMTGSGPKKRDELIKDIEAKGDVFSDSVNKNTHILLCEDPNSGSSKLTKAEKLGIKIMSYGEYFK